MSIFNFDDFDSELRKFCPKVKKIYRMINGKRELCYQFPPLDVCRRLFEEAVGIQVDWALQRHKLEVGECPVLCLPKKEKKNGL